MLEFRTLAETCGKGVHKTSPKEGATKLKVLGIGKMPQNYSDENSEILVQVITDRWTAGESPTQT